MFESFYGLSRTPFSRDMPTSELYESVILEETLGRLEYAAQRQWFAVVTGDCGTGKTTTIRKFTEVLDPTKFKVLYLSDSKLTPRHFYKGLLEQLGCESKFYRGDAKRQLHREIELMRGIHRLQPVSSWMKRTCSTARCWRKYVFCSTSRWMRRAPWRSFSLGKANCGTALRFKHTPRSTSASTCSASCRISTGRRPERTSSDTWLMPARSMTFSRTGR